MLFMLQHHTVRVRRMNYHNWWMKEMYRIISLWCETWVTMSIIFISFCFCFVFVSPFVCNFVEKCVVLLYWCKCLPCFCFSFFVQIDMHNLYFMQMVWTKFYCVHLYIRGSGTSLLREIFQPNFFTLIKPFRKTNFSGLVPCFWCEFFAVNYTPLIN